MVDALLRLSICYLFKEEVTFKFWSLNKLLSETFNVHFGFSNKLEDFIHCFHHVFFGVGVLPCPFL